MKDLLNWAVITALVIMIASPFFIAIQGGIDDQALWDKSVDTTTEWQYPIDAAEGGAFNMIAEDGLLKVGDEGTYGIYNSVIYGDEEEIKPTDATVDIDMSGGGRAWFGVVYDSNNSGTFDGEESYSLSDGTNNIEFTGLEKGYKYKTLINATKASGDFNNWLLPDDWSDGFVNLSDDSSLSEYHVVQDAIYPEDVAKYYEGNTTPLNTWITNEKGANELTEIRVLAANTGGTATIENVSTESEFNNVINSGSNYTITTLDGDGTVKINESGTANTDQHDISTSDFTVEVTAGGEGGNLTVNVLDPSNMPYETFTVDSGTTNTYDVTGYENDTYSLQFSQENDSVESYVDSYKVTDDLNNSIEIGLLNATNDYVDTVGNITTETSENITVDMSSYSSVDDPVLQIMMEYKGTAVKPEIQQMELTTQEEDFSPKFDSYTINGEKEAPPLVGIIMVFVAGGLLYWIASKSGMI